MTKYIAVFSQMRYIRQIDIVSEPLYIEAIDKSSALRQAFEFAKENNYIIDHVSTY